MGGVFAPPILTWRSMEKVEIKHKRSGKIKTIPKYDLDVLDVRMDWDLITSSKDDGDAKPDDNWTKAEIIAWLTAKGVDHKSS